MNKINLSEIPDSVQSWTDIVDYMLDNNADTLINDLSPSMMEYSIDDIEDSMECLSEWIRLINLLKI